MRPNLYVKVCVVLATVLTLACKPSPSDSPDSDAALPSGTISEALVSTTSVVQAIDHATREVTLEGADGMRLTFIAGDEVRNLDQVEVGDEVTVEYYESLAFEVKRADGAALGETVHEGASVAALGDKPAGEEHRITVVTTRIAAIDKRKATVVLEDADGQLTAVRVRDAAKLDTVAVGDIVEITLTEALAVSVTPAAKP